MAIPDSVRNAKNFISTALLKTTRLPGIHGVGIGASGDKFRVRVYVVDGSAPDLPGVLKKALDLPAVPAMPVFLFDSQFGPVEVEVTSAAGATLAAETAAPPVSEYIPTGE